MCGRGLNLSFLNDFDWRRIDAVTVNLIHTWYNVLMLVQ
jgi:hypothetical protein